MESINSFISISGFVGIPLLLCSLVGLSIVFERIIFWFFLKKKENGIKRGHRALETIVAIAPLLGILGTISGIIDSFDSITMADKLGLEKLSTGISRALITTAAGLIISVLGIVTLNFFESLVERKSE